MEKVASHINEMQKIYEDYGSVFDQLVAEQTGHDKEVETDFVIRFLITEQSKYFQSSFWVTSVMHRLSQDTCYSTQILDAYHIKTTSVQLTMSTSEWSC